MPTSAAVRQNPSRKMMDLLDERHTGPPRVALDGFVEGDELVVRADLPGVDAVADLCVRVSGGMLRISGDRRGDGRATYPHERWHGRFAREVALPRPAAGGCTTSYDDGVLEVRVPLVAPRYPRTHAPGARAPARAERSSGTSRRSATT